MKIIKVQCCVDCPCRLYIDYTGATICNIEHREVDHEGDLESGDKNFPDWCPLEDCAEDDVDQWAKARGHAFAVNHRR